MCKTQWLKKKLYLYKMPIEKAEKKSYNIRVVMKDMVVNRLQHFGGYSNEVK